MGSLSPATTEIAGTTPTACDDKRKHERVRSLSEHSLVLSA
jgi:hypothetical protein